MAGFLDRNTRVLDMVLTSHGKSLLSKGQLRFCYWVPYDDEVDYQPYIAESGSLLPDQLSASIYLSIEDTPVREATTGYKNLNAKGEDFTNVRNPIFTKSQGQKVLPRAAFPVDADRGVESLQRKVQRMYVDRDASGKQLNTLQPVDLGVERFGSTSLTLEFAYKRDSFPTDFEPDGFLVKMFRSGSNGLVEVLPRRDMSNFNAFKNDLRVITFPRGE